MTHTYTIDDGDKLTSITYPSSATNTFSYNGLDTRVGKVDSVGTATYRRDGADVLAPVLSDGGAVYTPGISQRRSGSTTYDLSDRLGSATRQTNSSTTTSATRSYDAFGMLLATTGTPQGPFGFAGGHGYQEDADSGLKLLGHRYYDASTGRFLTRDPVKDGRNWYAYCDNRPTAAVDPDGRLWWLAFAAVALISIGSADAPTGQPRPPVPPDNPTGGYLDAYLALAYPLNYVSEAVLGDGLGGGPGGGHGMRPGGGGSAGPGTGGGGPGYGPGNRPSKIPPQFVHKPAKKGGGDVYEDPNNSHISVRLDPPDHNTPFDHVHVNDGGRIIGVGGVDVSGTPNSDPLRHIPRSHWDSWNHWNSP